MASISGVVQAFSAMLSRKLSSNDDDDANVSRTTTAQLVNTLYINIFFFFLLVGLFEILRRKKSIYLNRHVKRFIETNRVPDKPSMVPFAWIGKIMSVSEQEILDMVGLDGYMCIRFIVVCFRTACFCSFWGLLVLVPIYGSTEDSQSLKGWDRFTIANIPEDPSADRLWAPVFMCYIFVGFFCQLMYIEYKNFIGKRVQYLVSGDSDTPDQTYYTVMVERVPAALRSGPMLAGFFERLYPGEFYSAEVAMDLHELEAVTTKRKRVRNKLEKYIAICWASQQRPVVWKKPSSLPDFPAPIARNKLAQDFGYEVVDAIEFYYKSLAVLNEKVKSMQKIHFDQRHKVDELEELRLVQIKKQLEDHTKGAMKHVSSRFAGFMKGGQYQASVEDLEKAEDGEEEETLSTLTDNRRNSLLDMGPMLRRIATPKKPAAPPANARSGSGSGSWSGSFGSAAATPAKKSKVVGKLQDEEEPSERFDETESMSQRGKSMDSANGGSNNGNGSNASSNRSDSKERMQNATFALHHGAEIVSNVAKSGVEGIAKEGAKTAEFAAKGALRGVLEATRALEMLTFGAQYRVSSTAFVTFKSRVAKCSSHQMLLSHEYYSMEVQSAPNPNDIVWENVSIPQSQINIRKSIADGTLIVGALFWSIVVTFISAISNLESISRVIPSLQEYSNTQLYQFANNYLAIGLLLILLAILPFIFDFIARNYEGLKTESEIQNSIMTRYFYYQLANVYVSVGLGSVATSLHEILSNPANILSILGSSVPSFSIFFANLVVIKTFTAVPIEMLRVFPLLDILSVSMCLDKRRCTRRELRTGAFADPPMLYGWIYPNLMMILMIMLTYSSIAPFLMPLCATFFALAYLMYKYQLLYVYINSYQSGGFMWYAVFNRSMVVLIAGVCTLLCYLAIRMTFISGPFYLLLPLPVLIGLFWHHCDVKIKAPAMTLSLEGAMDIDQSVRSAAANGERTPHDDFSTTLFRQPALNEGKLKPSLYRHGKPMLPESIYSTGMDTTRRPSISGPLSPRNTDGSLRGDVEEGGGKDPFGALSPTVKSPFQSMQTVRSPAEALSAAEGSEQGEDDGDEYDAEDHARDLDAAVDALLEDENTRTAVTTVSEQISAIRRSSIIGVGPRASSGEDSPEIGAHMKLHTFTSRDLEDLAGDRAEDLKQLSPPPNQPLLKGFALSSD